MVDRSHAYNSVWQLRADAWCRLEEAAERLSRPSLTRYQCRALLSMTTR